MAGSEGVVGESDDVGAESVIGWNVNGVVI